MSASNDRVLISGFSLKALMMMIMSRTMDPDRSFSRDFRAKLTLFPELLDTGNGPIHSFEKQCIVPRMQKLYLPDK
jgi:hypothetical protein